MLRLVVLHCSTLRCHFIQILEKRYAITESTSIHYYIASDYNNKTKSQKRRYQFGKRTRKLYKCHVICDMLL